MKMSKEHNYYTIMKTNNQEKENDENASSVMMWLSMIGAVILVVVGVCVYPCVLRFFVGCKDVNILGPYGDMYGPLNPLVSAFAFIALVYSLSMQRHQLKLQRKDLRNQRDDLKLQRDEMEKQREVSEAQTRQFEAQVKLAENAQKVDELYRRLSIAVQLSDSITVSHKRECNGQFVERINEVGPRAVRDFHMHMLQRMYYLENNKLAIQGDKHFFLDRYENLACWHCAMMDVLQYAIDNFEQPLAEKYVQTIMSTCSNPHKFMIYLYAGAENHVVGQKMRQYLLRIGAIARRIIPDFIADEEFITEFDDMMRLSSKYRTEE
jgi:hypothetical protein